MAHRHVICRGARRLPARLIIGRRTFSLTRQSRKLSISIASGRTPLLLEPQVKANGFVFPFAAEVSRRGR